jgi:hypothetical protein
MSLHEAGAAGASTRTTAAMVEDGEARGVSVLVMPCSCIGPAPNDARIMALLRQLTSAPSSRDLRGLPGGR